MKQREKVLCALWATVGLGVGVGIGVTGAEANREPDPPAETQWQPMGWVDAEDDAARLLRIQADICEDLPAEIDVTRAEGGLFVWGRCTDSYRTGP